MALLDSEVQLIKYELGVNNLTTGASYYVGIDEMFERVVAPYLVSGLITSSATAVTAATTPTQKTLTLAAVSGTNTQGTAVSVSVGDRLIVDVDSQQESAIVESMSGSTVTLLLSLAHSGTYPVTVEGGESIVRLMLRNCRNVRNRLERAAGRAGIKKVDEIEFFDSKSSGGSTVFKELVEQQEYWRSELYRVLLGVGDPSLSGHGRSGGSIVSVY